MTKRKELVQFLLNLDIVTKITQIRRKMPRSKKSKQGTNSQILNYIAWGLALIALVLSTSVAGYYFGYENAQIDMQKKVQVEKQKRISLLKKLEKQTVKKKVKSVKRQLHEVLKKDTSQYLSASHEFDSKKLAKPPKRVKREVKRVSSRPKLAIIIDDISTKHHVNAVKGLNLPLTMSFLPPSRARPNSAKLAAKEKVYMVHLPMEAQNFSAEEPDTLRVRDSQNKIYTKVKEIKKLFPRVEYINNHTGSKFTSNEVAMNRLIFALNAQKINFIDSRTTAATQAPKVLKNFGLNYVARDVFLDHDMDKKSILIQIKRAIKIAKSHGTAIAIGHPHKNTLLALRESKDLFKDIDLVYINKLH